MYTQRVTESYWKTCWKWGWLPYPCKRYRTVTKYCYQFSSVGDHCAVGLETHYGCENGTQYKWRDACLGWFHNYRGRTTICFNEQLEADGSCKEGESIPYGGEVVRPPTNLGNDVAIGGLALTAAANSDMRGGTTRESPDAPIYVHSWRLRCAITKLVIVALAIYGLIALFKN